MNGINEIKFEICFFFFFFFYIFPSVPISYYEIFWNIAFKENVNRISIDTKHHMYQLKK